MNDAGASSALHKLDVAASHAGIRRTNIIGTSRAELVHFVSELGEPSFRATQLIEAVHAQRLSDFGEFTTIPKKLRRALSEHFAVTRPHIDRVQIAKDGTRKYRFVADDDVAFEAVFIPEVAHGRRTNTLCVSSQSGCAVGCRFCFTASLRRNRNLTAAEIVGQVLAVQDDIALLDGCPKVTNIVFMGMGEPLLNFDEVTRAIDVLLDRSGANFPSRRITVSTSGIVPRIYALGRRSPVQLAISLNATTDETRTQIMPINKRWGLDALIAALRAYPLGNRRQITVEYVLLAQLNDSIDDAKRLVRLLEGIPSKINLLPLNPHDRTPFRRPSDARVLAFQQVLSRARLNARWRRARGDEIAAACGQLGETIGLPSPYTVN